MSRQQENKEIKFSPRQQQIVALLWGGFSYKMISDQLHIAIGTVKTEINLLHLKADSHNTAGVLSFAFHHGFMFDINSEQVYYLHQLISC
ncbi:MAG: hypothetical protein RJA07_1137 [Bacteroidota bacterium]|jgi:DNA-binding NarL/FixJ family response regulator